jgi:hypothetical protein
MGIKTPKCKILRHEATIEFLQVQNAFPYFTDLTENHYKAMIEIRLLLDSPQDARDAQLIVTPRTGTDTIIDFTEAAIIQIEDARSVTLNNPNNTVIRGNIKIIKDFCICCPDFHEVHRHEGNNSFIGTRFLFTDLTENHYKAMVVVKTRGGGEVVVTPRMGTATTIPLPTLGQTIIQIEDAQALEIRSGSAFPGRDNTVQIIKDFCISCN